MSECGLKWIQITFRSLRFCILKSTNGLHNTHLFSLIRFRLVQYVLSPARHSPTLITHKWVSLWLTTTASDKIGICYKQPPMEAFLKINQLELLCFNRFRVVYISIYFDKVILHQERISPYELARIVCYEYETWWCVALETAKQQAHCEYVQMRLVFCTSDIHLWKGSQLAIS